MKQKRIAPEFFKNSFYNFLFAIISHLGGAIFTIWIARILHPELFGTYTLTLSIVLLFMSLGGLGINEAAVRYISLNYKNKKIAKTYFLYFFKIKIVVSLFLALILILFSKLIASFYNNDSISIILIFGAAYLFFYSLMQFVSCIFYAFKNVRVYVYKESIFQIMRLFLLPFLLIFSINFLIGGAIMVSITASIVTTLFSLIYLSKKYSAFFSQKKIKINKKELFNFMKYLSFSSLSVLFLVYTDILILGKFVNFEVVGFYKTASSISLLVASFFVFTPLLTPIFTQVNNKKIKDIFYIFLYYFFMLSIPICIGTIMLSKFIVKILFGEVYLPSITPLYGLVLLIIFFPAGELFRSLFIAKGETKIVAKTISLAAIINITLNFILIYYFLKFGAIYAAFGAGIATAFSRFIIFLILVRSSKKRFKIGLKPTFIIKPIIASIIMAIFLFFFIRAISIDTNILIIFLGIVLSAGIYFLSLYFIKGFSKKEINYMKKIIGEIIKNKSGIGK